MACRVRYLNSAGIHAREIPGIHTLAQAFPANWLLYASLQCFPHNEPPIEIDAMVVMDDRVLLLEIKDWNGTLTHNGDQWLVNGQRRGRSPVDVVSMKAKKVKAFLKNSIPGFGRYYVDSRVVLTGSASKSGLSQAEQGMVWTLGEATSIASPSGKAALLMTTTMQLKKAFQFEADFERVTRNAKMFGPLEAVWDGYRVVEEDVAVHPRRIWREHRAERVRDARRKALLRVWSFDQLPPGLNSPDKRRFIADREMRAIGRLSDMGSRLVDQGGILLPVGDDKDEILTQHFELRGLLPGWTTLDRFVARGEGDLDDDDRAAIVSSMLGIVAELHASGIAHRDLGGRSIWAGSPTRLSLTGLMACQMPDDESLGDWASTLRGYADAAPEDIDPALGAGAKQRDVFALGRLAYEVLTGKPPVDASNLCAGELVSWLPEIDPWLAKSTAGAATGRFKDAREMADEFAWLVERAGRRDVDDTVIDRHQTTENPYVAFPIIRNLHQSARNHIFVTHDPAGVELVVKVWLGLQRGVTTALDLALTRLFDGVGRLKSSPVAGIPDYLRAALSPLGPFVIYQYEKGVTLEAALSGSTQIVFDRDGSLRFAIRLLEAVDALHGMGCAHGDIAPKNILVRDEDAHPRLLDLFDLTDIGEGKIHTPSISPEVWDRLSDPELDRYAALKVVETVLNIPHDESFGDLLRVVSAELERPAIETLEPAIHALRDVEQLLHGPRPPRIALRFPGGSPDFFRSDDGLYYLRAARPRPKVIQYSIAGIERILTFSVVDGQVTDVAADKTSFANLAHASREGVPVRLDISISDGPDSGFEDLFNVIAPIIAPPTLPEDGVGREPALDVRRYWRKLLEFEQALQPEVEILKDISPSQGALTAYAYERIGIDFDFDADSTVEVRLPGGKKIGEVNLDQTDAKTLVIEQSDRRLNTGDRVNLVDRRARTSLDRRTKAVERILDNDAAIHRLIDYFVPDQRVDVTDFGIEVSDEILSRYQLNDGQKAAFQDVVRYGPVGLLQGPPGTGKTHFIASLVHWLVTDIGARKVLIASQSHEAVNNAIEALLDLYKRLGGRRPSLLRIGSKGITDKIRPYHTQALQERYQSRFEAAFKHRVAGLGAATGLRRALVNDGVEIDRQLGGLVRRLQMLAAAEQDDAPTTAEERRRRDAAVANAVKAFRAAGASLLGRDVEPADAESELTAAFDLLAEQHPGTSPADIRKLRHLIELARDWSSSLASPHRNFEEFLAKTRSIVTATCVGVGQTKIRIDARTYDWVIVDEAARCTPSELAVPIQVGRRVLLVGDHRQLLPMTEQGVLRALQEEMPEVPASELLRSDFERAYLSGYGRAHGRTLTEQYRMAPPICRLVSRIFYEPDNVTLVTSSDRATDSLFENLQVSALSYPIVWVDTSSEPGHVEQPSEWDKTTLWNRAEVEAVLRLLECISDNAALVSGLADSSTDAPIGVICMYSAQKVKIEQAFTSRPWDARFRKMVRIDTVDSYQGKENSIVIVSLVRCNDRREQGHVRIPNRCNVALSRAKERLFIVGAQTMWARVPAEAPMRRVLEDLKAHPDDGVTVAAGELP